MVDLLGLHFLFFCFEAFFFLGGASLGAEWRLGPLWLFIVEGYVEAFLVDVFGGILR
jgi:hypothetical protein